MTSAEMTEMGLLQQAGAVAFTNGRYGLNDTQVLRRAMTYAREFGAVIALETREKYLAANGVMNEGLLASWLGLGGIPRETELIPLERDLRIAALTRAKYHASQISVPESVEAIQVARKRGAKVTCGISINHLSLNENDIGEYRTFFKLYPPLRSEDDRMAMVDALAKGQIDIIVSSHDPQDVDTKRLPFGEAADGAIGLETMLSAALRLHHSGQVPLMRLIDAMSTRPAEIFGLPGGTLKPGRPAISRSSIWTSRGSCRVTACLRARRTRPSKMPVSRDAQSRPMSPASACTCFKLEDRDTHDRLFRSRLGQSRHRSRFRLSAGLHPFRSRADEDGRSRRPALDRLGQYRRDQRAAHRQQEAGGRHAPARCVEGNGRGPNCACDLRAQCGSVRRFCGLYRPSLPVWLGFKGGKGVATYIGTLLGVAPWMVLVFAAVWLSVAFITRYSSLSALVATLVIPVVLWILGVEEAALVTAVMTVITYWRHKQNIERLIAGTESKIGKKG